MTTDRKGAERQGKDAGGFDESLLDALFAEARAEAPPPLAPEFQARLEAAALAALPQAPARAARPGWLARLRRALADVGGAPSLAGMGAAGLAGVWIGFAAPGSTSDLVTTFWQGAASVSPSVSDWAAGSTDTLALGASDLLTLIGDATQ